MSRPLVLHLINSGGLYGAERVLLNQLSVDTGTRSAVLCFGSKVNTQNPFINALKSMNISVTDDLGAHGLRASYSLLVRVIRELNPDIIHCHGYKETILGSLAGFFLRKRIIVTQHGFTNRTRKITLFNQLATWCCRFLPVEKVICVSDLIEHYYLAQKLPPARLLLLSNAIPVPEVCATRQYDEAYRFSCPEGDTLIGFVGRLSSEKGPDRFLKMLVELSKKTDRFKAVIVGDGPLNDELLAMSRTMGLQERVIFCGFRDDIDLIVKNLDILVIPSRTEGTPMVLLEAMSYKVVVAAFSVGGIPAVIENHRNGMLVEDGDVAALGAAVYQLLSNSSLRAELGACAREFITEHHNINEQAKQLSALYCE